MVFEYHKNKNFVVIVKWIQAFPEASNSLNQYVIDVLNLLIKRNRFQQI